MKKIIIVLIAIVSFSCKDKSDNDKVKKSVVNNEVEKSKTLEIEDDTFKIIMNIKVLEDDKLDVFFVGDSPEGAFNSDSRADGYLRGSDNFQIVTVSLPIGILPYKLRIDLGDNINRHETNIEIKSFKLQFNNSIIELDNTALDSLFQPNIYLQKTDNGYSRKIIDGKYDPFLIASPALITKIETEF